MRRRLSSYGVVLATVAALGVGPLPRSEFAQIAGQVIDAKSHAPLAGTVVALNGRGGGPPMRVMTDAEGRFSFPNVPPGVFGVQATHVGYFGGGDGRDPAGPPKLVEVSNDQAVTDLSLALWKLGAISGIVLADGDPLVGVEVSALRRSLVASRWRLASAATTTTDDRGEYRLSGLFPGEYVIVARPDRDPEMPLLLNLLAATPAASVDILAAATAKGRGVPERDARVRTYAAAYFRNVPSSSTATRISIDAGADRVSVDFQLKAARGVRVSGAVTGLEGLAEDMDVHLVRADSSIEIDPPDVGVAALESDGRFELSAVPPGKYVLTMLARPAAGPPGPPPGPPPLPSGPTWWARTPVSVGTTDLSGVKVPARKGSIVRGRLEFAGRAQPAAAEIAQVVVQLTPESTTQVPNAPPAPNAPVWRGQVLPDGAFATMGVPAGRYFLRVIAVPRGWTLLSAISGSRDVADTSFEIQASDIDGVVVHFVDHPLGGVNGIVQDASGSPAANATVLIFPATREAGLDTAPQARRFRSVRSLGNGSFGVGGLPPGTYFAVALASAPAADWQEPARLDALAASASRIEVGEGPSQPVTLSLAKGAVKK